MKTLLTSFSLLVSINVFAIQEYTSSVNINVKRTVARSKWENIRNMQTDKLANRMNIRLSNETNPCLFHYDNPQSSILDNSICPSGN